MFESMLPWEGESFWPDFSDPSLLEDGPVAVKTIQSILNVLQRRLGDCWAPHKIAEVQKRRYGPYHILGHISLDCWEPYLFRDVRGHSMILESQLLTFMSAFESLPVH